MITCNWKAEFNQKELELIEYYRKLKKENRLCMDTTVVKMANALDRYEAVLNEMEESKEGSEGL